MKIKKIKKLGKEQYRFTPESNRERALLEEWEWAELITLRMSESRHGKKGILQLVEFNQDITPEEDPSLDIIKRTLKELRLKCLSCETTSELGELLVMPDSKQSHSKKITCSVRDCHENKFELWLEENAPEKDQEEEVMHSNEP